MEGGAGEQGGVVVGQAQPGSFLMVVHDVAENKLKKLDIQELYAAITVELFQALIDAGYGSQEAYSGTGGLIADLNNDGSVSTADLLEFLTSFGAIESADPTTVTLTSTPLTADPSNNFFSPVKLDIGSGDAAVNSGDFTTIINVELDHFTISEGLNNSLTQYPNKSIVIKPAAGFETGAITIVKGTTVNTTANLYMRVRAFKPDGQPLNGVDGELYLLESIYAPYIGVNSYAISEQQISGNVLGINDSANGDPCASLKISYEIQDVSTGGGGYLNSAKIEGIEFQLTTNI